MKLATPAEQLRRNLYKLDMPRVAGCHGTQSQGLQCFGRPLLVPRTTCFVVAEVIEAVLQAQRVQGPVEEALAVGERLLPQSSRTTRATAHRSKKPGSKHSSTAERPSCEMERRGWQDRFAPCPLRQHHHLACSCGPCFLVGRHQIFVPGIRYPYCLHCSHYLQRNYSHSITYVTITPAFRSMFLCCLVGSVRFRISTGAICSGDG